MADTNIRWISHIKNLFVPKGAKPRKFLFGLHKGLIINVDLEHHTQFYLGLQEVEVHKYLKPLCDDCQTIIDVGAAGGDYTLYFLSQTTAKKIIAFEPREEGCQELIENIQNNRLNDLGRFFLSKKLVGTQTLGNMTTLDSFVDEVIAPCLIKIDIEGAEIDALLGAEKMLGTDKVRWLIEVHSRALEEQCIAIFKQSGYRVKIVPQAWWRFLIREIRPLENRWLVAWKNTEMLDIK